MNKFMAHLLSILIKIYAVWVQESGTSWWRVALCFEKSQHFLPYTLLLWSVKSWPSQNESLYENIILELWPCEIKCRFMYGGLKVWPGFICLIFKSTGLSDVHKLSYDTCTYKKKNGNKSRYNNIHQFSYMHARYVLHYRCGYVIRTCLKPVLNIIFYHVEFYTLMCRKCVKKKENFYSAGTIPIHTCTSCQSDYQLSLPDWYTNMEFR